MKCDCCGKGYDIMYRTLDTRVYCLDCSRRTSLCCYGSPVVSSKWFRVSMSLRELESLEERGHERKFEESELNPLTIKRPGGGKGYIRVPPKYKARTALNYRKTHGKRRK